MDWVVVVDVGNTSTSLGLAHGEKLKRFQRLDGSLVKKSDIIDVLKDLSKGHSIAGSVLCSVVPAANMAWVTQLRKAFKSYPLVVNHRLELGIDITYPKPTSIGADRLANASGAAHKYGTPVIVADFGTALTFDVISKTKGYVGGAIAPGLPLMTDYLADKTALLPHIQLKGSCPSIGRSTEGAMKLGAKVGYRGIVREIVNHLTKTMGEGKVTLCATGGYAKWALADLDMDFHFDPKLTLYGLSRIYDLNR
jgi:type III pantothenate kinase